MHAEHAEARFLSRLAAGGEQAPPEEFLYLACLHEGTGVESRTSSPSSTPSTGGSSTRRRCRTSATSCTTSAGTAAARPATARTART